MRKERVMAIITTMYFFFYCILISIFGVSLYDGANDKKRIKEQFEKSISNII